jgi:hypothetical protein
MVADRARDADAARRRQPLQPRGYVHAIAEDVLALSNHVAKVNPDAELDPLLWRSARIALGHPPLHLNRATNRVNHARAD